MSLSPVQVAILTSFLAFLSRSQFLVQSIAYSSSAFRAWSFYYNLQWNRITDKLTINWQNFTRVWFYNTAL